MKKYRLLQSSLLIVAMAAGCVSSIPESPAVSSPTSVILLAPSNTPRVIPTPTSIPNPNLLAELTGTTGPIYSLSWSPDGRTIVSAGYQQVNVWDVDSASLTATLPGPTDFVWGVA